MGNEPKKLEGEAREEEAVAALAALGDGDYEALVPFNQRQAEMAGEPFRVKGSLKAASHLVTGALKPASDLLRSFSLDKQEEIKQRAAERRRQAHDRKVWEMVKHKASKRDLLIYEIYMENGFRWPPGRQYCVQADKKGVLAPGACESNCAAWDHDEKYGEKRLKRQMTQKRNRAKNRIEALLKRFDSELSNSAKTQ